MAKIKLQFSQIKMSLLKIISFFCCALTKMTNNATLLNRIELKLLNFQVNKFEALVIDCYLLHEPNANEDLNLIQAETYFHSLNCV